MYNSKEVYAFRKKDLKKIREYFLEKEKIVVLTMINIGVNTGLRYSDLSRIKFTDIQGDKIKLVEKKTKKARIVILNSFCIEKIESLKSWYKKEKIKNYNKGYIFKSLYKKYRKNEIDEPMLVQSFNRYLKEAEKDLKIPYSIGSHSLRKTFGSELYKKEKDIGLVMKILKHSSESITLRYIGVDNKKIEKILKTTII